MNNHSNDLRRRLITDENNQVRDRQSDLTSCPPLVHVRQEFHTHFKRLKIISYAPAHLSAQNLIIKYGISLVS